MSNLKKLFGGMLAAAAIVGAQAFAQEAAAPVAEQNEWTPEISMTLEYASRYMSKGKVVNPERMFFGDISLSLKGFYVGTWVAMDMTDYNRDSKITYEPEEVDYYVGYGYEIEEVPVVKSLSLDVSYTYFDYPRRSGWQCVGESQHEFAIDATTGLFLNPGVTVAFDFETEKAWVKAHIEYSLVLETISPDFSFDNELSLFWGNTKFNGGINDEGQDTYKNALTSLVWDFGFTYNINENFSIGPFGEIAWALNHDIREVRKADSANSTCNMMWGFRLSANF